MNENQNYYNEFPDEHLCSFPEWLTIRIPAGLSWFHPKCKQLWKDLLLREQNQRAKQSPDPIEHCSGAAENLIQAQVTLWNHEIDQSGFSCNRSRSAWVLIVH